jgi:4a-hydroxytetrahydrobiopterin dehydratase
MSDLSKRKIVPVGKDSASVNDRQIPVYLEQLPGWQIVDREGIPRLEKSFSFKDFQGALDFTNQVGALAEKMDHHPAILVSWGRAAVSWWTHVIGGLHENDFSMAARTEELYRTRSAPSSVEEKK